MKPPLPATDCPLELNTLTLLPGRKTPLRRVVRLVGNPRIVVGIHGEPIGRAQPETGDSLGQKRLAERREERSSIEVACNPDISSAVDPEARRRIHPAAGVIHKESPVGRRGREHRGKRGTAGRQRVQRLATLIAGLRTRLSAASNVLFGAARQSV